MNYPTPMQDVGRQNEWRGPDLRQRDRGWFEPSFPLVMLSILALGAFTWYYLGSDIKRYIRIRNM
jgi:hypothetical protein